MAEVKVEKAGCGAEFGLLFAQIVMLPWFGFVFARIWNWHIPAEPITWKTGVAMGLLVRISSNLIPNVEPKPFEERIIVAIASWLGYGVMLAVAWALTFFK